MYDFKILRHDRGHAVYAHSLPAFFLPALLDVGQILLLGDRVGSFASDFNIEVIGLLLEPQYVLAPKVELLLPIFLVVRIESVLQTCQIYVLEFAGLRNKLVNQMTEYNGVGVEHLQACIGHR